MLGKTKALFSQDNFDKAATRLSAHNMRIRTYLSMGFVVFCIIATAWIGSEYVRETRLQATGAQIGGVITSVTINQGTSKRGQPRFGARLRYTFQTPDGSNHAGEAKRGPYSTKPHFAVGQPIMVLFDAANPARNTLRYGIEGEIRQLQVGLVMFTLLDLLAGLIVWRFWRWRRAQTAPLAGRVAALA